MEEIRKVTTNSDNDLVFIHLPFPHPPAKYNRFTKEFSQQHLDYVNNLALIDLILGDIRQSMESANQWDNSTIIISTDHQLRVNRWKDSDISFSDSDRKLTGEIEDSRIPFFLKLKNQKNPVIYEKPFNTLITRDLILAIMKGEITTPDEAQKLLDNAGN